MAYNLDPNLEYFIGVGLPKQETEFFTQLRLQLEGKDRVSSPPHITLKPPFIYHFEKPLTEQLEKWAKKQQPFTATFKKIGSFKQKKYSTLFLSPERGKEFHYLEHDLSDRIRFLPKESNYVPHLTLANRIDHEKIAHIKDIVRDMELVFQMQVDSITLYHHQRTQPWEVHSVYQFS